MPVPNRRAKWPRLVALVHFYLALGLGWGHAMLLFTPASLASNLNDGGIATWTITTMVGGFLAAAGLILKAGRSRRVQLRGLSIEFVGVFLLLGGPFQYMSIQVGFWFADQFTDRYALAWFAYAMIAALLVRVATVVPDFVAEATDDRKAG
jgi:hypothetical protein